MATYNQLGAHDDQLVAVAAAAGSRLRRDHRRRHVQTDNPPIMAGYAAWSSARDLFTA
jgi:hypothetical protein